MKMNTKQGQNSHEVKKSQATTQQLNVFTIKSSMNQKDNARPIS